MEVAVKSETMARKITVAASDPGRESIAHERDYHAWLAAQVRAVREVRLNDLDAPNLAEELEDMGRSAKKALRSQLVRLMAQLLKWSVQKDLRKRNPSAANRWLASIRNARAEIKDNLAESSRRKPYLPTIFAKAYSAAINSAVEDSGLADSGFPARCPWSLEDVPRDNSLPDCYSPSAGTSLLTNRTVNPGIVGGTR